MEAGTWQESLYPPEYILAGWPTHKPTEEEAREIVQGKPLHLPQPEDGERDMMAVETQDGEILAVVYWDEAKGFWQPKKVFS